MFGENTFFKGRDLGESLTGSNPRTQGYERFAYQVCRRGWENALVNFILYLKAVQFTQGFAALNFSPTHFLFSEEIFSNL